MPPKTDVPTIDTHAHFVPATFPDARGRTPLWPVMAPRADGQAAVVIGGKPFRVLAPSNWDVPARLAEMAAQGIGHQVLSPMPELLSHWFGAADADDLCRYMNDALAAMVDAAPARLGGIGMVPVQDPALAARRLADVKALGLRGVELGSHVNGAPLGDPRFDEFYAAAEALDLALMVHPLHPAGRDRLPGHPALAAAAAFPLDTALAGASLLAAGIPLRFPRLRIMLCHGGGALPWILPRLDRVWSLGGPLGASFPERPSEMAKRFFYDSVVYDPVTLGYIAERLGADRIVTGSDFPFVIQQDAPGAFAEQVLSADLLAQNALAFLGLDALPA
ncbi:amidohydrolase family protein [Zavarzinia compransoris]|uniref:Amidohydrolase n=1 Tax=Zavarzinia compransoris TaxID=1264899 RepID=A0A317E1M2_9PROT|nr:amidohydrolase family protein [Zavarzinia compransoris]PWR20958.1 amidohydrolase [Zavarzinia compransoris]TDP43986.1 aminocarboxymuconate-semialdehyde decarboxylase [Zavarzinia compransoris]